MARDRCNGDGKYLTTVKYNPTLSSDLLLSFDLLLSSNGSLNKEF